MTHTQPTPSSPRGATRTTLLVPVACVVGVCAAGASAQTFVHASDADRTLRIPSPRVIPLGVFHLGEVVVGPDTDGDGVSELLLTTTHHYESTGGVQPGRIVLFSGATGTPLWTSVGASSGALFGRFGAFVDDLNGDGAPDLLVGESGAGRVVFLSGATGAPFDLCFPPGAAELTSFGAAGATFRRESDAPRFVAVGSPGIGRLHFYSLEASPPQHLLTFPVSGGTPLLGLCTVNLGDLNGDGFEEIAATEPRTLSRAIVYSGSNGSIAWHANVSGLSFGQAVAHVGDVTGDGGPDVLIAASTYVRVYRGADGEPDFQIDFEVADTQRSVVGVGDVTGDGVPDFAVGTPNFPPEEDDSDPETIKFGRVTLLCGRTRQTIRVYDGPSSNARMGHHLAALPNADGAGATAVVARAFRAGPDETLNGVYAYVFNAPSPCPGDANFDRVIDKADFSAVLSQYGLSGPLSGDLNFDGVVDFADFALVLARYGAACD